VIETECVQLLAFLDFEIDQNPLFCLNGRAAIPSLS